MLLSLRVLTALLGIRAFGVHLTGFVRNAAGDVAGVWLQKRADNKPTYPGMMDNMVAGGMSDSLTATQVLFKEAEEEASIPAHLIERAKSAGSVSFLTESDRGIHANTEYVFDLELPADFKPSINDGEVQGFALITTEDIMPYLLSPNFKLTSAPVLLDFLIRHGIVNSNTVVDLPQITEMLHTPISFYYRSWPTFPSSSFVGPREGFPTPVDAKYSSEQAPSSSSATYSFSSTSVVPNTSPHLEGGSGPSSVLKNNCSFSIADDDCASMKSEDRDSDADLYQICLDQGT
ncbi:hypothetical protein HAZT_HAZT007455 [Hyalella azteca]|uniref:Nudix hydrolase domain-containing protein n=1 Tax=Hyalella azteca TaxID=294128 RepID=A0A6A0H4V0_HYAAZ|nr:hypothetical protein HAZT_HAZT007455 [Hyalella azteca]